MIMMEHKNFFDCDGIIVHWGFKLLPKGFEAITLFGHIFDVKERGKLRDYLQTYPGSVMINHERIHMSQANTFKTRYLGFYALYIWYWIIGLFKYGLKNNRSYYNIPFEREAYKNENNFVYKESHWRDYKD